MGWSCEHVRGASELESRGVYWLVALYFAMIVMMVSDVQMQIPHGSWDAPISLRR